MGKIEFRTVENGLHLQIAKLFPFSESGEELTLDELKELLKQHFNKITFNEKILGWYLQKSKSSDILFSNITIASGICPKPLNSHITSLNQHEFGAEDHVYWDFVYNFFNNVNESDLHQKLPCDLFYCKKGGIIATQKSSSSDVMGMTFDHEKVQVDRHKHQNYVPGDNVLFDENQKTFVATVCGYVQIRNDKISIIPPFFVTENKLSMYFMNFERLAFTQITKLDVTTFLMRQKIDVNMADREMNLDVPAGEPILLVSGILPGESFDAAMEILVETEMKQSQIDENGKVDYREIHQFPSVVKDELLARKTLMSRGDEGKSIFGNPILSRMPKDVVLKNGYNTYIKETKNEILIYSSADGRIEFKNGLLSVYDQLKIPGDIDFSTGNINTKVSIHINGSVRTGFSIKSEKSVFIKGTVEDNCVIEAGGDIVINGGVSGKNNVISSQGNMGVKFIEGGNIFVKGHLTVHRFIMGATIECQNIISVMGAGINLNEKGAIIDSNIYIKNKIYCPTVGNDTGQKTYINFGYNKLLNTKIKQLEETLQKNRDTLEELNSQFECDITSPNIHSLIKEYPREKKDKVIAALQERNKLDKQYVMLSSIYNKDLETKKNEILNAAIFITNKVFPPLSLECDNTKKLIDQIHPPSKYFFNTETKYIERDRFLID